MSGAIKDGEQAAAALKKASPTPGADEAVVDKTVCAVCKGRASYWRPLYEFPCECPAEARRSIHESCVNDWRDRNGAVACGHCRADFQHKRKRVCRLLAFGFAFIDAIMSMFVLRVYFVWITLAVLMTASGPYKFGEAIEVVQSLDRTALPLIVWVGSWVYRAVRLKRATSFGLKAAYSVASAILINSCMAIALLASDAPAKRLGSTAAGRVVCTVVFTLSVVGYGLFMALRKPRGLVVIRVVLGRKLCD